jgi:chemotaxis signal transduction protein
MISDIEASSEGVVTPSAAEPESPDIQFLQVYLAHDQPYLLPVEALVELLTVPIEQVMPMFGMAPWVVGVHNLRGEVLWVADFNHFLGLAPWYGQANLDWAACVSPSCAGLNQKR